MKAGGSYEQRQFTIYCIPTFSSNNYVTFGFTEGSIKNDAILGIASANSQALSGWITLTFLLYTILI